MEQKMKHLEFIQNVITRMNSNSFLIKGWAITLVSALFALAANGSNIHYVLISYIVIPVFWVLDGFYIQLKDNIEISTIMLRKRQKKKLILVWMLLSIIEVIEHGGTVYSQKHYGHFMV